MFKHIKQEDGFTIQELVVVLVVGSLIFIFSNITFSFIQKTYSTWTGRIQQHDDFLRTSTQIIRDIHSSKDIFTQDDSAYALLTINEDTVQYHIQNNILFRDEVQIFTSDSLQLLMKLFADTISAKQKIDLHFVAKSPNYITVHLTVENLRGEKQRFKHHLF